MIRWLLLVLVLLAVDRPAQAEPSFKPRMHLLRACTDGETGMTPIGTAVCAREGTEAADARIAALLRKARSPRLGLRTADLTAAQTHWRRYRDLHCDLFDREEDGQSGSQTPAEIALCRFDLTLRREAELRWLVYYLGPR